MNKIEDNLEIEDGNEEIENQRLFIDDYRIPGITIDWKKARELYKRIFNEKEKQDNYPHPKSF